MLIKNDVFFSIAAAVVFGMWIILFVGSITLTTIAGYHKGEKRSSIKHRVKPKLTALISEQLMCV